MLFNSIEFLFIFLPIVFSVYFFLNKQKLVTLATGWLVIASLYFYAYWKLDYLPLILISMIFNYSIGKTLSLDNLKINKRFVMLLGISLNVLLLFYFKYFDFLISNINYVLHSDFNYMHLALPLGISFFTFQQIAYVVDSYKGLTKEYDFLSYALFVTFFPQLIAGPIVHHGEMMPQFERLRNRFINHKNIMLGMFFIAIGLSKKILIADNFSVFVGEMFDNTSILSFWESWIASLSYTFQLYFDFSGYCDMAVGIGYLFNILLPQNFNSPYKADSIQDFWRRWHITLSRFLRDYIYIPLGGNRNGIFKTYRNLFYTFLIGGIWHGANWTFIIWGVLHGFAICLHRFFSNINLKIPRVINIIMTFSFIDFAWVFFRAKSVARAWSIIKSMFMQNGYSDLVIDKLRFSFQDGNIKMSLFLFIGTILLLFLPNSNELSHKIKPNFLCGIIVLVLLLISILQLSKFSEFLYFQF